MREYQLSYIVNCTRKKHNISSFEVEISTDTIVYKWFRDIPSNIGTVKLIQYENKEGLGKRYNEIIEWIKIVYPKTYHEESGYLIFAHDDFIIQDTNLLQKLHDSNADVVGIAGSKAFDLKSPVVWHKYKDKYLDKDICSGGVLHSYDNKQYYSSFGLFGDVLVLDGCFLAVKLSTIIEKDLRFDENFTFHFYDLDFCLSAFKKGCKLKTVPIFGYHESPGDFTKDESFKKLEEIFIKKWKN